MSNTINCDVLVVGGGPGGYPAAIRAGQLGLKTVIVEGDRLGGTCLIRGCIPSKAVIHAASRFDDMAALHQSSSMGLTLKSAPALDMGGLRSWKDGIVDQLSTGVGGLLKAAKVQVIDGWATFTNAKTAVIAKSDGSETKITAQNVILANGSSETEIPALPFDGEHVLSSTHVLDLDDLPKTVAIVGAGYIGVELGSALTKLGSKVTFVEAGPQILPSYDSELVKPVSQWLKKKGVEVKLNTKATGVDTSKGKPVLSVSSEDAGEETLSVNKIIVAVGRRPRLEGWGLETMGVDLANGFIAIDNQCRTSMSGVFAIGDITGEPMLAHRATTQGEIAAEIISGQKRVFDPTAIAAVCFTEPEIVGVGLSPNEAHQAGIDVITGRFPFAASGRALAMDAGQPKGFVRVTARKDDHVIIGMHAVGHHVAELSGEFALALEMGAVLEDVSQTIHVHPTLSESTAESVLSALGHPIHIAAAKR